MNPLVTPVVKTIAGTASLLLTFTAAASAQVNAGSLAPEASLPFTMTKVADFNLPWRIAFLPDGRMLITEKVGPLLIATQQGEKTPVQNVPAVLYGGQGGMLGVYVSPTYTTDQSIYLTYSEPGDSSRPGSSLALARARLALGQGTASLEGLQVIWRDGARGRGGQFGAALPRGRLYSPAVAQPAVSGAVFLRAFAAAHSATLRLSHSGAAARYAIAPASRLR